MIIYNCCNFLCLFLCICQRSIFISLAGRRWFMGSCHWSQVCFSWKNSVCKTVIKVHWPVSASLWHAFRDFASDKWLSILDVKIFQRFNNLIKHNFFLFLRKRNSRQKQGIILGICHCFSAGILKPFYMGNCINNPALFCLILRSWKDKLR